MIRLVCLFSLLLAPLVATSAVDGTTAERVAFAKKYPKCRSAAGTPLVACPPFQIVYTKPKCQGGVLTWMEISAAKASTRSLQFAAICALPPPPVVGSCEWPVKVLRTATWGRIEVAVDCKRR